jgi:hypothetical protein
MRLLFPLFALVLASPASAADVLTSRNNLARTGVNAAEAALTPASVNATTFGKLWTLYADGQVVAQPLFVSGLAVDTSANATAPRVQGTFDAVLLATMHNTVYLYDADNERPGPDGRNVPLWATWLGKPRPGDGGIDMWATSDPEWGILGTPVIDPTKSIVYVVAWHDDGGAAQDYHYRLHALRLKDGTHLAPAVEIQAPGLNSRVQKQRPGLLLAGGILYIAFGGDGNRGLVLAYDSNTLARTAVWSATPTGNDGGIWQAGQAPTADAAGNVYLMTGNGTFGDQGGSSNYGQSFVRLRLDGNTLVAKDHFTPCNAAFMSSIDSDLGSSGPVLIPGTNLIFGGGKEGRLYLLSKVQMGKHVAPPQPNARTCPNPNVVQEFQATHGHIHSSPVYWPGADGARVYVWSEMDRLRAYRFANGRIITTNPRLSEYRPPDGMPGGMLSLSSQGGTNGILWAVVPLDGDANKQRGVKGIVLALDARDVTKTLWTSEQAGARDRLGLFARFVPPTIADGKVFVATYGDEEPLRMYNQTVRPRVFPARYQVAVYGLLPSTHAHVDQSRDDVQLVTAAAGAAATPDTSRCRPAAAQTLDCTDELERIAGAPSLERVVVPSGYDFAGCEILRVTTAAKAAALPGAVGIGFYSAEVTTGQFSASLGRLVPTNSLKAAGNAVLKNGQPAVLHEFAALVNCQGAPGARATKQLKPYMDFAGGPPPTVYRNWDPVTGNYSVGGPTASIDRRAELLR